MSARTDNAIIERIANPPRATVIRMAPRLDTIAAFPPLGTAPCTPRAPPPAGADVGAFLETGAYSLMCRQQIHAGRIGHWLDKSKQRRDFRESGWFQKREASRTGNSSGKRGSRPECPRWSRFGSRIELRSMTPRLGGSCL